MNTVIHAPDTPTGYVDQRTAAKALGVSLDHVRALLSRGDLTGIRLTTDRRRTRIVEVSSIEAYLGRPELAEKRRRRTAVRATFDEVRVVASGAVRYPLTPLLASLRRPDGAPANHGELARILQCSTACVATARVRGLSVWQADKWACTAGLHPSEVWGDDWWTTADQSEILESMRRHPSARR